MLSTVILSHHPNFVRAIFHCIVGLWTECLYRPLDCAVKIIYRLYFISQSTTVLYLTDTGFQRICLQFQMLFCRSPNIQRGHDSHPNGYETIICGN
jgi:hypothetical protein